MIIEKEWTTKFFNDMYLDMFMTRSVESLKQESNIIEFFTCAKPFAEMADFCCGIGSTANALLEKGFKVQGIEYADHYVTKAHKQYPLVPIFKDDALTFNFNKKFDVVYNWYSSFGYFNNEQNIVLLNNMKSHLKNKGKILIDIYNSQYILDNFKSEIYYDKLYQGNEYLITRKSFIDHKNNFLKQIWIFENKNTKVIENTFNTQVKLYLPEDILSMLESVGFTNCHTYHNPLESQNLLFESPKSNSTRIIFIGEVNVI